MSTRSVFLLSLCLSSGLSSPDTYVVVRIPSPSDGEATEGQLNTSPTPPVVPVPPRVVDGIYSFTDPVSLSPPFSPPLTPFSSECLLYHQEAAELRERDRVVRVCPCLQKDERDSEAAGGCGGRLQHDYQRQF